MNDGLYVLFVFCWIPVLGMILQYQIGVNLLLPYIWNLACASSLQNIDAHHRDLSHLKGV